MTLLRIDQVSKTFGTTHALRKVSFDVNEGEVVTLIGESGSGKTTLGKIVLRLTPATSGKIYFQQNDISAWRRAQLREHYRDVQGVFQDPFSSFNPVFHADRVFEMIRTTYFPHVPRAHWDDKVETVLQAVSLTPGDVLGRYPHQLSGGQQQRMLIARALLLDVKLLIADEIISMLDASTRVDILNLLVDLKRGGLSILFITHDLALGNYLSDRTVILRHGAIMEMGATAKVFGNPRHPYTQSLLTAVPQLHRKWTVPAPAVRQVTEARPVREHGQPRPAPAEPPNRRRSRSSNQTTWSPRPSDRAPDGDALAEWSAPACLEAVMSANCL